MNYPIKFRVFRLNFPYYYSDDTKLEDYVIEELNAGYIVTDIKNFEIDFVRVVSHYSPAEAKKTIDAGGVTSKLVHTDEDDLENV